MSVVVREGSVNGSSTIGSDKTSIRASLDLNKPGDFYKFYVDVVNKGSLDAKLDSLVKTSLTVAQKKYLNYTITYKYYVEVKPSDLLLAESRDTIRVLIEVKEELGLATPIQDQILIIIYMLTHGIGHFHLTASLLIRMRLVLL